MLKNKNGFTLIELLVAIFIIALISTLVTVSFLNIKRNNRDAKRINDVTEIQMALENYKFFEGSYPSELTPGEPLIGSSSGNIYMAQVPENPEYQSYDCPFGSYDYFYDPDDGKYKISFCLEGKIENYSSGLKCAISEGIVGGQCIPLTVVAGNPTNGQVDEVYAGHTFSALSGTEPYSFSVASGSSLPAGLSLSSAGSLSGTPTTYGNYSFFIEVTDAEAGVGQREFSMTIDPAVLALGSSNPADGYEGIAYAGHTFSASGGVTPYTFSLASGTLPAGLSLSSAGGLTGTPNTQNSYNFTIKVVDSLLVEVTQSFGMSVLPPPCGSYNVVYSGVTYPTVLIGTQCWLSKDLSLGTMLTSAVQTNNGVIEKYCYVFDENQCTNYGGLYTWDEAMQYVTTEGAQGICPSGWHIPSKTEFETLVSFVGSSVSANVLRVTSSWRSGTIATNNYGFSAKNGGYANSYNSWGAWDSKEAWWTSTNYLSDPTNAWMATIYYSSASTNIAISSNESMTKSNGLSIRCLRD